MGVIVEHNPGPDFRQSDKPTDVSQGNVWYNTVAKESIMADGVDYWRASVVPPIPPPVPPPVITSPLTASGNQGSYFSYQITATNPPIILWGAAGLPAGLNVNTSTGLIDGIPTGTGLTNILLSATNAGGTGTQNLALTIAAPSIGTSGYSMGGDPPGTSSRIIKLTFSSETSAQVANLTFARYSNVGLSGPSAGYSSGGAVGTTDYASMEKLLFSSDSVSTISAMSVAKQNSSSLSSQTNGYVCIGGLNYNDASVTSNATKLAFSSDTLTELSNLFPIAGSSANSGVGDKTTKGFVVGYRVTAFGANSNTQKLVFSTDTASNIVSGMITARTLTCGVSSDTQGYELGGWYSATVFNQIERVTFSSESIAQLGVTLSTAQYSCMPTTSRINGYGVGGGDLGGWYSTIQKIAYATETMSLLSTIVATGSGCGCENLS